MPWEFLIASTSPGGTPALFDPHATSTGMAAPIGSKSIRVRIQTNDANALALRVSLGCAAAAADGREDAPQASHGRGSSITQMNTHRHLNRASTAEAEGYTAGALEIASGRAEKAHARTATDHCGYPPRSVTMLEPADG